MPSIGSVSVQSWRFARAARLAVLVGCGVAIAGCTGTIETFRSLKGSNKNDPDPVSAAFSGNMTAAEAAPYPNLASVPPPPTRATTVVERQKLTESLIAERTAAATGWAKTSWAAAPAPALPPPSPALPRCNADRRENGGSSRHGQAAVTGSDASRRPPTRRRAARRGAPGTPDQAPPRDSELQVPQVRSVPDPDVPRPAPPPTLLPPLPASISAQLPPAAIASAAPEAAPSVPQLAPIAPPSAPSLGKAEPPRTSGITTVAMLDTLDSGQLDPAQVTLVAARYKERIGSTPPLRAVRVIAYTPPPAPGADPLGGYHDALERAQGIAKVLTEAGIPEKMIQTEAKPAAGPLTASRVEIQFLP